MTAQERLQENIEFIKDINSILYTRRDEKFVKTLLRELKVQRSQAFRSIARKTEKSIALEKAGIKNCIWEHVVPSNYLVKKSFEYWKDSDLKKSKEFIEWYANNSLQIYLPAEEDAKLCGEYKSDMPKGWDWEKDDIFARYTACNVDYSKYV